MAAGCGEPGTQVLPTDWTVEQPLTELCVEAPRAVEVELPADALGLTILSWAGPEELAGLDRIELPSGELLIDGGIHAGAEWITTRAPMQHVLAVPLTSAMTGGTLPSGAWRLDFAPRTKRACLWVRRGEFDGGWVDVDVYLGTGVDELTVTTQLEYALPVAGLELGEVTVRSLDADRADTLDDLAALFGRTEPAAAPTVRLLALPTLLDEQFPNSTVWGQVFEVPGAPVLDGDPRAGIAIRVGASAATIRHELGHLGGLFHTTRGPGIHDPLDDTPACPAEVYDVDVVPRGCEDFGNMMFPGRPDGGITPEQTRVIAGSLLYRAR